MFWRNEIRSDQQAPARQVYAWHELEEYLPSGGMWAAPKAHDRAAHIYRSAELMADPPRFQGAMMQVLDKWPRSTAQAMTTPGLNRRAWIGHAGAFIAVGSPEETTRLGWHELDEAEQVGANLAADAVIAEWERRRSAEAAQGALWGDDWDA